MSRPRRAFEVRPSQVVADRMAHQVMSIIKRTSRRVIICNPYYELHDDGGSFSPESRYASITSVCNYYAVWRDDHPSLVTSPLPPSLMDCTESISSPDSYSPHRFVTFSRAINELLVLAQPGAITLIATGLLARSTTIAPRPHHDPPQRGTRVAPKCALGDRVVNS